MTRRRSVRREDAGIDAGLVDHTLVADEAPHVPQRDLPQQVGGLRRQDPLPADQRDEAHRGGEGHHVHVGLEILDHEDRLGAGLDRPSDLLQQPRDHKEHPDALGARPGPEPTRRQRAGTGRHVAHRLGHHGVHGRPL